MKEDSSVTSTHHNSPQVNPVVRLVPLIAQLKR